MPYDDPDPSDPMTLHGVAVETSDDDAMQEMAECFIEEYARLGLDADRILHMFNTQGYAGPYLAATVLGKEQIGELVKTVLARWGGRRAGMAGGTREQREVSLTVLNG
ncbi:MAG: hypothetical protein AABZ12_13260 [Planctomycetota bacterium]